MKTVDSTDRVLGIARSKTVENYAPHITRSSTMKLQRNASNQNFFKHELQLETPAPLERTASLGAEFSLNDHFKRSMSLNEMPRQSQIATQTSEDMSSFHLGTSKYEVSPPYSFSPYLGSTQYPYEQQQANTTQMVYNSVLTPLHSGYGSGGMYFDTSPPLNAYNPYPINMSHIPPSPMTSLLYTSPYPTQMMPPMNNTPAKFELPLTTSINAGSTHSLHRDRNTNFQRPQPQSVINSGHLFNVQEQTKAERMLEELRIIMRPLPNPQNGRFQIGKQQSQNSFQNYEELGISWSLIQIKDIALDFARDQFGSRFIQSKLQDPTVPQREKEEIFEELTPFIPVLCKDVFGNYVIQKLLEIGVGTKEQHNVIFQRAIQGNMLVLASQMYGCRVVQKLVEQIFGKTSETLKNQSTENLSSNPNDVYDVITQNALIDELKLHVNSLVRDQNGNHVIQKCIEQIRPISRLNFFFDSFIGNYQDMAKHPYGCRVVQRVLENGKLNMIHQVVCELVRDLNSLVIDQYANYVIQHIVEHRMHYEDLLSQSKNSPVGSAFLMDKELLDKINTARVILYNCIASNILFFSQHKFGSNVVESCLKYGNATEREILILQVLSGDTLLKMIKDSYANYVVQKVIDKATKRQLERIFMVVNQNDATLRSLTYGKHIINKLKAHSFA